MAKQHAEVYSKLSLHEKCPNTEFFSGPYFHVFGLNTDRDLLRKSPYLVRVRETKDQKKTPYLDTLLTVPVKYQRWSLFLQELTT